MKNRLITAAVGAALLSVAYVPAASAQSSELEQLKAQLQALQAKVEKLEKDQKTTEASADKALDTVAQTRAGVGEWVGRFQWKGDFRYRNENIKQELNPAERNRDRMRVRAGFIARVNDTVRTEIQLTTGESLASGGYGDARSPNQTLTDANSRKRVWFDTAYAEWAPNANFKVTFGKMRYPWFRPTGVLFFDNDINPEGIAARFASGPFFANAFGMVLSERATASDASLLGGQMGLTGQIGGMKLTGALGYFDVGSVQGQVTTTTTTPACAANPAFFLGSTNGNTTVANAAGCPTLLFDFNMIEAVAQAEFTIANQPLQIFAQYIQNEDADDLDTGWLAGFNWGKASNPRSWEFGYAYGLIEKDSTFGQFVDSDFGGGITDIEGSIFKVGFAPAKNWVLNGTYFMNQRFIDAPGAIQRGYDRYQVDLNWKF